MSDPTSTSESGQESPRRKGPLSFLSGALTAGLLSWLCLGLSRRMALYYALHPPHYASAIAQSIATALKTLLVGMAFLATFSFGFIALGLSLAFLRSLVAQATAAPDSGGSNL
ncbi:MAG: DUF3082 domain-containing protein [Cyanobacteria bacterium J06638_7]